MDHKKKEFDAVEMSRKLRQKVSREIVDMTPAQIVAYFKDYTTLDVLLPKDHQKKHFPKAA